MLVVLLILRYLFTIFDNNMNPIPRPSDRLHPRSHWTPLRQTHARADAKALKNAPTFGGRDADYVE
jgi:hypothetical protein